MQSSGTSTTEQLANEESLRLNDAITTDQSKLDVKSLEKSKLDQQQREPGQLKTSNIGMVQQSHSRLFTDSHGRVTYENSSMSFATNPRVEVSGERYTLQQNANSYESKLDNEFLKETANIPVIDNNNDNFSNNPAKNTGSQSAMKGPLQDDLPPPVKSEQSSGNKQQQNSQKLKLKRPSSSNGGRKNTDLLKAEAMEFMHGVMDVSTYVGNFSVPVDPNLIIVVTASHDAYILRDKVPSLQDLWPGVEVRQMGSLSIEFFKRGNTFYPMIVVTLAKEVSSAKSEREEL